MQFVKDPTSDVILFTIYGLYIVLSNFNVKNRIKREWRERERERKSFPSFLVIFIVVV